MKVERRQFAQNRHVLSQSIEGQMKVFLLFLLLAIPFSRMAAQTQIDVAEAGLMVATRQQTIAAGENALFEVRIRESALPLVKVIGFELTFDLASEISPAYLLDYLGSCMPANVQTSVLASYNASAHAICLSLPRVPAFTMRGLVLRLNLNAMVGLDNVAKAIKSTGGFIIVEDIGFKQAGSAGSEAAPQPIVFPTFARGMLQFDWRGEQPEAVTLVNVTGAQVMGVPETAILAGYWATAGLPSGQYKVVIRYAAGRSVVRNVWVE